MVEGKSMSITVAASPAERRGGEAKFKCRNLDCSSIRVGSMGFELSFNYITLKFSAAGTYI
jgi:hypothetical protein